MTMIHPTNTEADTMQAWLCGTYGGPETLTLKTLPRPVAKPGEVLVRILATAVSSGDARIRALNMPKGMKLIGRLALGLTGPRRRILGSELSGVIEAIGAGVTAFKPGDAVVAFPGIALGSHATHRTISAAGNIALKPANLSFAEGAALSFGGSTALHFLRRAGLKRGERLLVIGASGTVGTAMVQLAHHQGAHVTGTCSTANLDLVRSLGADDVLDYTQGPVVGTGARYDIIADTVGVTHFSDCHPSLNEHGRYLSLAGGVGDMLARGVGTKRSLAGPAAERREDFLELVRLAEAGLYKPAIDSTVAFENLPDAHRRTDSGRKRGSMVVTMQEGSAP
jgi:NADPH:quinone reductase-like Zn-dependent oxidoreductase